MASAVEYRPFGRDTWRDPYPLYRRLRDEDPVHRLGAAATRLQGRVVLEELLRACPRFAVDTAAGVFADAGFTRRYESLPFVAHVGE